MKTIASALVLSAVMMSVSAPAHAGGWIAKHIIKPIAGKHAAREADKIHERLGKPLDQLLKAATESARNG